MKTIDLRQLDEKDKEIADALNSLGLSRNEARTLTYLHNVDEARSFEIENGTGLRQPEVRVVVKEVKERDWINEREEKKLGKGRPYKIFSLKIGFNEIVAQLENQQKKVADEIQLKVERLKDITRS